MSFAAIQEHCVDGATCDPRFSQSRCYSGCNLHVHAGICKKIPGESAKCASSAYEPRSVLLKAVSDGAACRGCGRPGARLFSLRLHRPGKRNS